MSKVATKPFIDLCIEGEALLEDIDDFIDEWHESSSDTTLHEYLGMTWDEYSLWAAEPDVLPQIVTAHREGRSLDHVITHVEELPMAARSANPMQAKRLVRWLEKIGKIR